MNMNPNYMFDYLDEDYVYDFKNASKYVNPDPTKFPIYHEGDIIDEEQSVRWNREEVARRIQLRKNEVARLEEIRQQNMSKVNKDAIESIAVELLRRKIVFEEDEAEKRAEKLFIFANRLRKQNDEDGEYLVKQIINLVDFAEMWEAKDNNE